MLARIKDIWSDKEQRSLRKTLFVSRLLQTSSRSDIPEYSELDEALGSAAGRINGKYGEVSWTPIRYVNRVYSRSVLAGLYRTARVGLVTPLRDGMNLVAKEYVAVQDPDDPGILILSRFAGAAIDFRRALLVNPYDAESVASALTQALAMPIEERRARHEALYAKVCEHDVNRWQREFLTALGGGPGRERFQSYAPTANSGSRNHRRVWRRVPKSGIERPQIRARGYPSLASRHHGTKLAAYGPHPTTRAECSESFETA